MNTYFDTSAAFKLLVDEEGSELALALWDEAAGKLASRLIEVELRSALGRARRLSRVTARELSVARRGLRSLLGEVDYVEIDAPLVAAAGQLAEALSLRAFDAVHLACAIQIRGAVLATWDGEMVRAAKELGVPLATSPA